MAVGETAGLLKTINMWFCELFFDFHCIFKNSNYSLECKIQALLGQMNAVVLCARKSFDHQTSYWEMFGMYLNYIKTRDNKL